jgi:hypothetical protein
VLEQTGENAHAILFLLTVALALAAALLGHADAPPWLAVVLGQELHVRAHVPGGARGRRLGIRA